MEPHLTLNGLQRGEGRETMSKAARLQAQQVSYRKGL